MQNCCIGEIHGRDELVLISANDGCDLKRIGRQVIPKSGYEHENYCSIFWRTVRRLVHVESNFRWDRLGDKVKSIDI